VSAVVIQIDNVSVDRGGRRVLDGITFNVKQGEFVGLVGPNGAGKTTLLKAILGLVPVVEGRITLFGRPLGPRTSDRRSIGYVPQRAAVRPRFPATVEDVVMMNPKVMEVAAIGVPDEKSGEAVKIVVVKKDESLTDRELLDHCRQHLTNYKLPRMVEFRTEPLPKTPIGKILRRELRAPAVSKGKEAMPA